MRLTLIRHATLRLELDDGRTLLVDPMLDDAGARPAIDNTANDRRNPLVPLPWPAEEVVRGIDGVLITHRHQDHLDPTAEALLPRDVPAFCQPEDEAALRELGLAARPVHDDFDWEGLTLRRVPAQHGTGDFAEALAPVSGFLVGDLYLAGDTIWYGAVEQTIERHAPRVAVLNGSGARFNEGDPIVMTSDDLRQVAERVPTVVVVHLEAINHCPESRAHVREAVPGALVPEDGETLELIQN
jgi:L-ascorbate metabolism protein UlaG (beta-lactamase superfamily)